MATIKKTPKLSPVKEKFDPESPRIMAEELTARNKARFVELATCEAWLTILRTTQSCTDQTIDRLTENAKRIWDNAHK